MRPEPIAGAVITIRRAKLLLKRGWKLTDKPEKTLDAQPYREIAGHGDNAMVARWDLEDAGLLPKSSDD